MRSRAEKRHNTAVTVERAKKILRRGGWDYGVPSLRFHVKAKKFADSRYGCNCCLCMNPRKLYKGKSSGSLTRSERTHTNEE